MATREKESVAVPANRGRGLDAPATILEPIGSDTLERVAGWLSSEENCRWLYFGPGRRSLDAVTLKVMSQRDLHLFRVYTNGDGEPIGVTALSDIDRQFGTASVWYVLGEKEYGGRGLTTRAVCRMLDVAFGELGLGAVHAWTVETNEPSQALLRTLGFRLTGRRRRCHYIDGVAHDRLLFDLLAEEHEELD